MTFRFANKICHIIIKWVAPVIATSVLVGVIDPYIDLIIILNGVLHYHRAQAGHEILKNMKSKNFIFTRYNMLQIHS